MIDHLLVAEDKSFIRCSVESEGKESGATALPAALLPIRCEVGLDIF